MNWARAKIICENVCGFATFALALVNNRYVLTSFPRFEIDRFLTTGCCLVIQSELSVQLSEVELPPPPPRYKSGWEWEGPANTFSRLCGRAWMSEASGGTHRQSVTRLWNSFQFHSISLGYARRLQYFFPPSSSSFFFLAECRCRLLGRVRENYMILLSWEFGSRISFFTSQTTLHSLPNPLREFACEKGCCSLTQTYKIEWMVYRFQ